MGAETSRADAAKTAYAAAAAVSARLALTAGDLCVVCLQTCLSRACKCSFMHSQCAQAYVRSMGPKCRVCSSEFAIDGLHKRPRELEEEDAIEKQAHKRRRERETEERRLNLEWARKVAPCAAQIMFRHFQHMDGQLTSHEPPELSFDTVVLSLLHSGPEYLDDLSERLADTLPSGEVESAIRRLHSVAEGLQSSDSVDEACIAEFMSVFHTSLNGRIHGLPTPPDDQR